MSKEEAFKFYIISLPTYYKKNKKSRILVSIVEKGENEM